MGSVFKISIVPKLNSSANVFIVIAGIKNNKTHGANRKKLFISAKPAFNMLKSSLKTHKNNPLISKKIPITKYAIGEEKNNLNSLFKIVINVLFFIY
tara:strand:+ start:3111 stop:3401 length:291 start_codon:yes stop_codon:yes gene_type:complete